jgi:hypothetical protein
MSPETLIVVRTVVRTILAALLVKFGLDDAATNELTGYAVAIIAAAWGIYDIWHARGRVADVKAAQAVSSGKAGESG